MTAEGIRKIGLVLASIHTGASNALWSDVAHLVQKDDQALFVFPGGRLECQENYEYLRNSLYPLVNHDNLEGVIIWGSSLGGSVSVEEVKQYYDTFGNLPCVTIGLKREGFPDITFDAYSGVKSVILHCIHTHKAKRIAFIRGPENHQSAQDRYRAYVETLQESSLGFDPLLVSDPFPWTEGASALNQLIGERKLIPGRDFDTLACSSDMMMFDAGKRLEALGYQIPDDVRIVGFNDSSESHLLKVPCTTAKMPVQQLALMSWSMILLLLDKQTSSCPDILLPSEAVIRRSCGCNDSLGGYEHAKALFINEQVYLKWLTDTFLLENDMLEQNIKPLSQQFSKMQDLSDDDSIPSLLRVIEDLSYGFLDKGGDSSQLSEALHWYSQFFGTEVFNLKIANRIRDIFLRQQDLVSNEHAYALSVQNKKLNALKCDLLGVRNLSSLPQILQNHLPSLGLSSCFMVMHEDEAESRFVGGYDEQQVYQQIVSFEKHLVLPPSVDQTLESGVYVVEPLFMENQPLGYLVLKTSVFDGSLMEELRTALSSSIKGTFLLDAANRARELAERAQRSRTEFFANVSDGLRYPLESILHLVKAMQREGNEEVLSSIDKEIFKATHLLDLTLSQIGALELEREVFDCMSVVHELLKEKDFRYEGPQELPALYADRVRVKQVFTILCDHMSKEGSQAVLVVSILFEGLKLSFQSSYSGWKTTMNRQDPGISLAERIVLMHGGRFILEENRASLYFPWPSLTGEVLSYTQKPFKYIADDLETEIPHSFVSMEGVSLVKASSLSQNDELGSSLGGILWDARRKRPELQIVLHQLFRNTIANRIPFICLGCPNGFVSLSDALSSLGLGTRNGVVFYVGEIPGILASQLAPDECFELPSLQAYKEYARQKKPMMLITDSTEASLFEEIRKGSVVPSLPIVIIKETFTALEAEQLSLIPRLLLANNCVSDSSEFLSRLIGLLSGDELLSPLTGALVKRAIVYIDVHGTGQISRWQLAEAVNVSEDYLTRIFRKELGLSPWDYLNRYRIHLATALLRQTGLTINEVASQTGFQDQAYFCRVFKKIKGSSPGKIRSTH